MRSLFEFVTSGRFHSRRSLVSRSLPTYYVWILIAPAAVLGISEHTAHAQQTVDQMIDEYQQTRQELRDEDQIIESNEKHPFAEVEKAIQERYLYSRRISALANAIKARGRKVLAQVTPPKDEPPDPPRRADIPERKDRSSNVELKLTDRQQRDIAAEEHRIEFTREKLKKVDPDSKLGELYKTTIQRSEARIRQIRTAARQKLRIALGGKIRAKQNGHSVETKAPERRRPWVLGDWPWDFDPSSEFAGLKEKYYQLQAEMGAVLLIRRNAWTQQEAIDYNDKLKRLCERIVDTEERIAFGLGDWRKFDRAIRTRKKIWEEYLAIQKITDEAEATMERLADEYNDLKEKTGYVPGETQVKSDDPDARKMNDLAIRHKAAIKHFEAVRLDSERAKMRPGPVNKAREQRIADGLAFTVRNPPKLEIHRGCLGGEASTVYKEFLNEEENHTFLKQSALRYMASQ